MDEDSVLNGRCGGDHGVSHGKRLVDASRKDMARIATASSAGDYLFEKLLILGNDFIEAVGYAHYFHS